MNKDTLITTKLKNTSLYSKKNKFLGSWCFDNVLEESKYIKFITEFPWDDRDKCYSDYIYLKSLNKRILTSLSKFFNEHFKLNKSNKFWEIILGPWIISFTAITLHNWNVVNKFLKNNKNCKTFVFEFNENEIVLNDMGSIKKLYYSDEWNHYLFSKIIEYFENNNKNSDIEIVRNKARKISNFNKFSFRELIKLKLNKFSNLFEKEDLNQKHLFYNSYINNNLTEKIIENLKYVKKYKKPFDINKVKNFKINNNIRKKIKIKFNYENDNDFEKFIINFLPFNIPKIYLEGFNYLKKESTNLFYRNKYKSITTATAHYFDDIFKYFLANQIDNGCKLIINQHGGSFGMLKWFQFEDHAISISDFFLTWGWRYNDNKIIPMTFNKLSNKMNIKYNQNGGILNVLSGIEPYPLSIDSKPYNSFNQKSYYEIEQVNFYKNLNTKLQKLTTFRLYPNLYSPNEEKLFNKELSDLKIDKNKNLYSSMNENQLFVGTSNSTAYLEALYFNYPTICFWNSNNWEVNNNFKDLFFALKETNIFHENASSASSFINMIWNDLLDWWNSKNNQKILKEFKNCYISESKDETSKWLTFYKNIK